MGNKTKKQTGFWPTLILMGSLTVAGLTDAFAAATQINLQNTEIRKLVETVSKATGKNFIIDPAVRGNITFVSGKGISEEELYEAFLSILQVHGLEAIEVGNVIKIVPLNKGRSQVAPIIEAPPPPPKKPPQPTKKQQTQEELYQSRMTPEERKKRQQHLQRLRQQQQQQYQQQQQQYQQQQKNQPKFERDRTVTQVFTLQYIPVNTAIQTLQPLAGQGETRIQFNQSSNAVIVTGRKQNVDRLGAVIRNIDKPNNQGFELVALRHSVATQLANTLRGLMASGKSADGGAIPQRVYISVDQRTNSILVAGDKADRERMRQVIAKLDIPRTQPSPTVVIKIKYADATQLLNTLKQLEIAPTKEGGVAVKQARMAVDKNTNSIIISGEQEDREPIIAAIQRLDVPPSQPPDTQVVKLQHADAAKLLQTLKQLQITPAKEGESAIKQARLAVDESTNSIIIAGDRQDRAPILAAIKRLDVPRTKPLETQVIPIKYAVATQVIQTLKQLQVAPTEGNNAQQIRLAADERTNSVLISGKQSDRIPILAAIRKLDIPKAQSGGTRVIRLRYAQAEEIVSVLKETASGIQKQTEGTAAAGANGAAAATTANATNNQVSIQADKASNSVVITAPQHIQVNLQRVISQLDRRRAQILIEAIIAEVSTDLSNQFGFGVAANARQEGAVGYSNFGGLNTALGLLQGTTTSVPGGFLLGIGGNKFGLVMEALRGDAATNILSTPTLVTLDNEEASIVVGQNVPFITGSFTNGSSGGTVENPFQTIERQDVGLTLKVFPQVNRDRTITMKIEQEVSSVASSSAASDVITNKRTINTNVMVEDGQVLVLGGLIQDDFRDSESKVPVLSDIPVVGKLFRENTTTKTKQNLMAFIHPVIMPDRLSADAYTRAKYHTLQKQQQRSKVLQRGSLGAAAVFPNIECIDGYCAKGSADDLHFNDQAVQVKKRSISQALRQPLNQQPPRKGNIAVFGDEHNSGRGQ